MNCLICNKALKKESQKYCSKKCNGVANGLRNKGTKKPEVGLKISESLKGCIFSEERKLNIVKGKKRYIYDKYQITEEEQKTLEKVLSYGYSSDYKNICIATGIKSVRSIVYYKEQNLEKWDSFNIILFNPKAVQQWPFKKWELFLEDCKKYHYSYISEKYDIKSGSLKKLCDKHNIKLIGNSVKDKKMTSIEKIVFDYFINNSINFNREVLVNKTLSKKGKIIYKYRIDFIVDNICLEINGDYWHVNPRLCFNNDLLTKKQKRNIINDKEKKEWCINNNYRFYTIWEMDLIKNINKVLEDFVLFTKNNKLKGASYGDE